MNCKTCGKGISHYWITKKPYCNKACEKKSMYNGLPKEMKDLFGNLSTKK